MNDCRSLVLALVVLGAGCTAIVDAGGYEILEEGGRGLADAGMDGGNRPDARTPPDADLPDARDSAPDAAPDDDAMVDEQPPAVDLEKLATTVNALATWACINVSRCEGRLGGEAAARGLAVRFCHPAAVERAYLAELRAGAEAGDIAFDTAQADACIAALDESNDGDSVDCSADLFASSIDACEGVFVGTLAAESACTTDLVCAPGLICAGNDRACGGLCQAPGRQGDACADSTDCAEQFVCLENECVSRVRENLPCMSDAECLDGRYCSATGVCAMQGEMDEPCVVGNMASCSGQLLCEAAAVTGEPALCGTGVGTGGNCSADHPCALGGRCVGGKCGLVVKPLGTCNSDAHCPAGTFCGTEGCEPKPVLEEACDESAGARPRRECIEGVCADEVCTLGGESAVCRFEPALPFSSCEGYCASNGMCVSTLKISGRGCAGDYECDDGLLCMAREPEMPAVLTCLRPECAEE